MSNETHKSNPNGHGDYERRDIGISGVVYFIVGLIVAGFLVHFIVTGLFGVLNRKYETEQPPVSPLVKNAPADTRRIPPQYGNDYQRYLKENFPQPHLETDERTELNDIRLREEDTLSTYGWVDQKAGVVRIPIDRAIDVLAQRGLPVRQQSGATTQTARAEQNAKGSNQ
jgi:hypothetical protein